MNPNSEKLRKEIQKIIYQDLEIWKQLISDLETKKIKKKIFKKHYVNFLQKIEDNITHFTQFFLKREAHLLAHQILEDNLEKTAMLENVIKFLSEPQKEILEIAEKEQIILRKFQPSVSTSPTKDKQPILYRASEIE